MPVCLRMSKGGIMTPEDATLDVTVSAAREAMRTGGPASHLLCAFFNGARGAVSPPCRG